MQNSIIFKAPRHRRKGRLSILNQDFFKYLISKHPDFPIKDWESLKKLCGDGLEIIANIISTEREGVEFPKMLGFVIVASCEKPENRVKNHGMSNKYGQKVIHNNLHTDGRVARILYTNHSSRYHLRHREVYAFTPARFMSRNVSKRFSENPEAYMKFLKNEKVSWRFRKNHISHNKNYYK